MEFFLRFSILIVSFGVAFSFFMPRRQNGEISGNYCLEYSNLVSQCKPSIIGTIVGGVKTSPGEFPHMAAIGWKASEDKVSFNCGGSLISDRFVLTVAHCSKDGENKSPDFVRLGDQNLADIDDGAEPVDYIIKNFTKHEQYDSRKKANDIALIELEKSVKFTKFIRPACLADTNYNSRVIATGWGKTDTFSDTSDDLNKVVLNVFSWSECNDFEEFESNSKSQICAGGKKKDTCQGDSGGPLQIPLPFPKQCVHKIIGLTSFGSSLCGSSEPAIYTKVFHYIDWIENKVWPSTNQY